MSLFYTKKAQHIVGPFLFFAIYNSNYLTNFTRKIYYGVNYSFIACINYFFNLTEAPNA